MAWTVEQIAQFYNKTNNWLSEDDINTTPGKARIKPFEWSKPAFYHDPYDVKYRWSGRLQTKILKIDIIESFRKNKIKPTAPNKLFVWDHEEYYNKEWFKILEQDGIEITKGKPVERTTAFMPFFARVLAQPEGEYTVDSKGYLDGDKG